MMANQNWRGLTLAQRHTFGRPKGWHRAPRRGREPSPRPWEPAQNKVTAQQELIRSF
jgi:hypothetical protein